LNRAAGVPAQDLVVHAVRTSTSDVLDYLQGRGVDVRIVEPFDNRSHTCNKISAALALASAASADRLYILTDSDIAIGRDPAVAHIGPALAAKVVDAPNPPLDILRQIFQVAGLELPRPVEPDFDRSDRTVAGHFNGGLYTVPGAFLPILSASWSEWARWLLDRGLLGRHGFFVDQVAMTMAIVEKQIAIVNLGREWNFPTHVPEWIRKDAAPPAVVHYHGRVEPTGLISVTGSPPVDGVIAVLNEAISGVWHEAFPNETFWNWRYRNNPSLGSGFGSRGVPLKEKRRLLRDVVARAQPASVLDVGCGDGRATQGLRLPNYTGLDVSEEAVRLARAGRPEGSFHVATIADWTGEAELTLCLDVLVHQSDADAYRRTVRAVLKATTRVLLVSGYEKAPSDEHPMFHFHEPLSITIENLEPNARRFRLREEGEISTFAIVKPPFDRNWPHRRHSLWLWFSASEYGRLQASRLRSAPQYVRRQASRLHAARKRLKSQRQR
jgi:SAM-dependent methyltransferase